jgi:hypothetical protein
VKGGGKVQVKAPEDTAAVPVKFQAFIKEEVLVNIYNDVFASTPEQVLNVLLADDSTYTNEYRSARKDKNLNVSLALVSRSLVFIHMCSSCCGFH